MTTYVGVDLAQPNGETDRVAVFMQTDGVLHLIDSFDTMRFTAERATKMFWRLMAAMHPKRRGDRVTSRKGYQSGGVA